MNKLTNGLVLLLILAGIVLGLLGVYLYVDAAHGIDNNRFHQLRESGEELEIPNRPAISSLGLELYESQQEYNALKRQQNDALRVGGVGLAFIGLGWMGHNFASGLRKRSTEIQQQASSITS